MVTLQLIRCIVINYQLAVYWPLFNLSGKIYCLIGNSAANNETIGEPVESAISVTGSELVFVAFTSIAIVCHIC